MKHYKITLETGKKRNISRTMYVQSPEISGALSVSKRIPDSALLSIREIPYKEYIAGVKTK